MPRRSVVRLRAAPERGAGAGAGAPCGGICMPPIGTSVGGAFLARSESDLALSAVDAATALSMAAPLIVTLYFCLSIISSGGGTWTKPACCCMSLSRYAFTRVLASFSRDGSVFALSESDFGLSPELVPARRDHFGELLVQLLHLIRR